MRVVTLLAAYGAGGSVIGPGLAHALEMPFLDRAVPARMTGGTPTPSGEEAAAEERTSSLIERIVATFANLPDAFGPGAPPEPSSNRLGAADDELRRDTEARVRAFVEEHGSGVVLGWGATVLLPEAFHVRLYGPPERRVEQAIRIEGLDREEAERRLAETDRVRWQYMKRLHGRDLRDPSLYHLAVDSTAMSLEATIALLASAATAFWAKGAEVGDDRGDGQKSRR